VRLTVVGCAAAWARGRDAASSCYLVEETGTASQGGTAVLLDLGQGAFTRLASFRRPESLTAVAISHAHPDHCVDLIPLRHFLRYEARLPPGRLTLLAPAGLPARFDSFLGETDFLADLRFVSLEPGELALGGLNLAARRIRHSADSFAFRLTTAARSGPGLVYSGDCADARELVPILRPGDTLLAEASFGAGPVPEGVPHLDAALAAAAARDGGAARLVLTHLQSGVDRQAALERARRVFAGAVRLAAPGLVFEIGEKRDDRPVRDSGRSPT
jgi:ribonuclease BN (tRNA processing enzyme)